MQSFAGSAGSCPPAGSLAQRFLEPDVLDHVAGCPACRARRARVHDEGPRAALVDDGPPSLRTGEAGATYELLPDPQEPGRYRVLRLDARCPRARGCRALLLARDPDAAFHLTLSRSGAFLLDPVEAARLTAHARAGARFELRLLERGLS